MSPDCPLSAFAGPTGRRGAALALLGFVFFARAWLIKVWGSPVPYWDEWDAQALRLIRPWLNGTLRWTDFFAPHNEHRIVLTRLSDLTLFLISGKWNLWWQLMLNAFLHAATATVLACLFWNGIPRQFRPVWIIGLALLFIAPAGWQNALWGFQSHGFYWSLFSVLALGGLLLAQPLQPRWWLGWLAALLALFTVGSGLLAAASAVAIGAMVLVAGYLSGRKPSGASVFSLCAILALVVAGWSLQVRVPQHEPLHAHSLVQFGAVFFHCLSWPWVDSGWFWLVLYAPVTWLAAGVLRRRAAQPIEQFVLGIGLLVVLYAAAVAYTRGAVLIEGRPLPRYQDPFLLGVAANLFILLGFAGQNRPGRIGALLWMGIFLAGLLTLTTTNLSQHLPVKRYYDRASLVQVRAYLATGDASVFFQENQRATLHPDIAIVRQVLDDPQLRRVLPGELSDANARPPWLIEYSPQLTMLSMVGLLLMAFRCARSHRSDRAMTTPASPPK